MTGPGGAFGKAMVEDPDEDRCYCGHSRRLHRSRRFVSRCHLCPDRHYYATPADHERQLREYAVRADPAHVCTEAREVPPASAFGQTVGLRVLLCVDCGRRVER